MARRRHKGRPVSGILLLDKPEGMTSNQALQQAKRLFDARKAGHTGSLDPLATGVLPLCFGEATKASGFLLDADKQYRVTARFGLITETGDADGTIVEQRSTGALTVERVAAVAETLTGRLEQVPPMYSAVKQGGKRLYELAREGQSVEREARVVTVERFDLLGVDPDAGTAELAVHCSKGTYVRTLVEDLGEQLGPGAHVAALRRTAVAPFSSDIPLVTLDALEETRRENGPEALDDRLLPVDAALTDYPLVRLAEGMARYVRQGQAVWLPKAPDPGWVRLYDAGGQFMGMGEVLDDARVTPRRLMQAAASRG